MNPLAPSKGQASKPPHGESPFLVVKRRILWEYVLLVVCICMFLGLAILFLFTFRAARRVDSIYFAYIVLVTLSCCLVSLIEIVRKCPPCRYRVHMGFDSYPVYIDCSNPDWLISCTPEQFSAMESVAYGTKFCVRTDSGILTIAAHPSALAEFARTRWSKTQLVQAFSQLPTPQVFTAGGASRGFLLLFTLGFEPVNNLVEIFSPTGPQTLEDAVRNSNTALFIMTLAFLIAATAVLLHKRVLTKDALETRRFFLKKYIWPDAITHIRLDGSKLVLQYLERGISKVFCMDQFNYHRPLAVLAFKLSAMTNIPVDVGHLTRSSADAPASPSSVRH